MTAVLFDMDGVLVDSEDYWVAREREEIFPDVVADGPIPPAEIAGMNYREIFDYLDEHYEVTAERETFLEIFDRTAREIYTEEADLLPGVEPLLADLHAEGHRTAIVSSSPHEWIDLVIDRFDLDDFDAVISAETVDRGKPAPDVYEYAAGTLGVPPEDCVAVEDSEHGVEAAVRAGMAVIGYRSGADEDVDLSAATVVVTTPDALRETIRVRV
ncbi:MAG: HAD family hydrolase [Halanaeroarchaeum sp.]